VSLVRMSPRLSDLSPRRFAHTGSHESTFPPIRRVETRRHVQETFVQPTDPGVHTNPVRVRVDAQMLSDGHTASELPRHRLADLARSP